MTEIKLLTDKEEYFSFRLIPKVDENQQNTEPPTEGLTEMRLTVRFGETPRLTVKEKTHFLFKHRHLIVRRWDNLTESEPGDLRMAFTARRMQTTGFFSVCREPSPNSTLLVCGIDWNEVGYTRSNRYCRLLHLPVRDSRRAHPHHGVMGDSLDQRSSSTALVCHVR
jgi:hypothetical protein